MKDINELLIHSLDHELSATDQERLDVALSQSAELTDQKEALIKMRSMLASMSVPIQRTILHNTAIVRRSLMALVCGGKMMVPRPGWRLMRVSEAKTSNALRIVPRLKL